MVNLHLAYTEPLNPAGATPTLTRAQIWRGLQRKVRRAQDFIPARVDGCEILSDTPEEVVRVAHFLPFAGKPAASMREVCRSYWPTRVDFHQPNGAVITNTISDGPGLTENDYLLTFTFEFKLPDVAEGSAEATQIAEERIKDAQKAVHSTIVAMRELAAKGELDG